MPSQRIRRTAHHTVVFDGELLFHGDNRREPTREHKYWHELAVYFVDRCQQPGGPSAGHRLVKVTYLSTLTVERPHEWVSWGDDVRALLQTYDPRTHVVGYPVGPKYDEHDERLLARICERWARLCDRAMHEVR